MVLATAAGPTLGSSNVLTVPLSLAADDDMMDTQGGGGGTQVG